MTKYVKRRRTVEHTWTCSACKALNRGRDLTCPKCGKTKSDETYDTSSKATVTDPSLIAISRGGPNWDCSFCRFENRASHGACTQCGANRFPAETRMPTAVYPGKPEREPEIPKIVVPPEPEPEAVHAVPQKVTDKRIEVQQGGYRDAAVKRLDDLPPLSPRASVPRASDPAPALPRRPRITPGALAAFTKALAAVVAFGLLTGFGIWLFSPWHEHVHISSATWTRQCDLHHRVTLHGEGWGTPIGAFNQSCESRQHGTHNCNPYDCHPHNVDCRCHQVADGESCSEECTEGENGFSECEEVCETEYTTECDTCTEYDTCYEQCPTYDDWCRYSYYEWPVVATTRGGGTDRNPVVWPDMAIPQDGETYRVDQTESYHVAFTNEHGTWTTDPSSAGAFARYHAGARWDIQVTHAGTVSPVREERQ